MIVLWLLGAIAALILLMLLTALVCYLRVFYSPRRKPYAPDEYEIPEGDIYEPHREEMIGWMKAARKGPYKAFSIPSFDGLTLHAKYYECQPGAPIEILFHGYRGNAERDLSGGIERCFTLGRNALIIDQRACGDSAGHTITFGVHERRDCLAWINFAIKQFGEDVKLILTGVSMGAATVMMAAAEELPRNVIYVLADCGYTSAREIISKIIDEMHLPTKLLYPFVKLGARLFGRFDLEETSPIEAMKKSRVPVIFIHGDTDAFVPHDMSLRLHEACVAHKKMVTIPGAGHGLAYPIDKQAYLRALSDFMAEVEAIRTTTA